MISDKIPTVNDNHTATQSTPGHHIIGLDSEHLNGGTVPGINISMPSCFTRLKESFVYGWRKRLASACQQRALAAPTNAHKFVATGNVLLKTVLVSEAKVKRWEKFAS